MPPTEVRSWSIRDLTAAAAILADERRHPCGHSIARSSHPAMDGRYRVDDDTTCYACKAFSEYEQSHKDSEPEPWRIIRVVETDDAPGRLSAHLGDNAIFDDEDEVAPTFA